MLEYLVSSQCRRRLLTTLWIERQVGSVRQLASRIGAAYSAAHREIEGMWRAGLATRRRTAGGIIFAANFQHPGAATLLALLGGMESGATTGSSSTSCASEARSVSYVPISMEPHRVPEEKVVPDAHRVLGSLAAYGAPLLVATPSPRYQEGLLSPEVAIVKGIELARRDATMARALPVVIHRALSRLDLGVLRREARRWSDPHTLGLFLHLTAELSAEPSLHTLAERFRDRRRTRVQDFFLAATSRLQRTLAEMNTPPLVLSWGYRMNLGMDAFESTFRRFAYAELSEA